MGEFDSIVQDKPMLHDTVKIEFKEKDGVLEPFFKKNQSTQPTVRYTCMDCGCTLSFNYWVLQRKIKGESHG